MESLQERFAPKSVCFGCGPANRKGLHLKSRIERGIVVAEWEPRPQHHAFRGALNGGIIGTILDCHSNWAAAYSLMRKTGEGQVPATVTAEFCVKFLRPTPMGRTLHLRARVVKLRGGRATVESSLLAGGEITATFRGTFVAVGERHQAFSRWK